MSLTNRMTRYTAIVALVICMLYFGFRASESDLASIKSLSAQYGQRFSGTGSRHRKTMEADEDQHLAEALQSAFKPSKPYPSRFPRIVWQAWLGPNEQGSDKFSKRTQTWEKVKGFEYKLLKESDALAFVQEHYASRPAIIKFWESLRAPVIKADFLRYLIMLAVGGVYSDIDTSNLVHPDRWIPIDLGASTVNAIIGIEYDDHTYRMFVRPIGLCQWTLMSKPGHPIFEIAVQRVISNLEYIARRKRVTLEDLTLEKMETLEATGPGMITDAVMQALNDQGQNVTWATLHDQREPRLYGDVLVLPINGFAGHQRHSHAGNPAYGERYIQHHFARTWYAPDKAGGPADEKKKTEETPKDTGKEEEKPDAKEESKQEKKVPDEEERRDEKKVSGG
ncbi:hypothetical protein PV08_06125 [Exophiala spinifera]|uniref:Uncharacterized protein n=1 Tax=Exophiala spinifera TaxID=91928 RepID=A0A0D2BXT2_9EURO|nr:uncharacterized protein PV08_06125 [Exophiala spinifera]KIW16074.1 hypothetical protein PV08_06125 [Exophiala spinifera]